MNNDIRSREERDPASTSNRSEYVAPLSSQIAETAPTSGGFVSQSPSPPRISRRRIFGLSLVIVAVLAGIGVAWYAAQLARQQTATLDAAQRIKPQTVGLSSVVSQLPVASSLGGHTLTVNGQTNITNSLVLEPSDKPTQATAGQLYYDAQTNLLSYYNGTHFIPLAGGGNTLITNIAGATNISNLTSNNITTTGGAGGAAGTAGSIALFTAANTLGDSIITQNGNNLSTGSGVENVTLGSLAATSATSLQAGTGGLALLTDGMLTGTSASAAYTTTSGALNLTSAATATWEIANSAAAGGDLSVKAGDAGGNSNGGNLVLQAGSAAGTGVSGDVDIATQNNAGSSGNINITTGSSSTTASGNITIDAGSGFVSGTIVDDRDFESGTDDMVSWFGDTVAQSSAQAHGGLESLAATILPSTVNWGVISSENSPGAPAVPGHHYFFSAWVRAATTPEAIHAAVVWSGGSATPLAISTVTDSTSGWTQITGSGTAPAGTTQTFWEFAGLGSPGETHYFDDLVVTDLSSSSATSEINLGAANAQIITIGNANEIGATSINGGSGINLSAGSASINVNGGAINVNGSGASNISTSSGALDITSAATATWGIAASGGGDGGNLTIQAGTGAFGDNNGGDLVLQAGAATGTGIGGSVIIKPQTDSSVAFQVQNSLGSSLLSADTSAMNVTVSALVITATLTINGHIITGGLTPSVVAGSAACTSPTVTVSGNDTSGTLTITTGSGCTAGGKLATLTFASPYGAAPHIVLTPGGPNAQTLGAYVDDATISTAAFDLGTTAVPANITTYKWNYWVTQ